jgi:glycerol transport system ATP-binding protein
MAAIELQGLAHTYAAHPSTEGDWALRELDLRWSGGGAYALLGPSGCGKTTLLNIISGLLRPSRGRVLFDGRDVTTCEPRERNIAQVFQFPVVYDTMSVYDNLAFPLLNRGVQREEVDVRVRAVADALGLQSSLKNRAQGLTADAKQKISLGRGLVRTDVAAILFDEPLTVIDPHLKWRLRSELKALHQKHGFTMIYVTHDQTEALTFADEVVVMNEGRVVQIGTPAQLFDRPQHVFVGHFIGSPGMNLLPAEWGPDSELRIKGVPVPVVGGAQPWGATRGSAAATQLGGAVRTSGAGTLQIGVRPEHVRFAAIGLPVQIDRVVDAGHVRILDLVHGVHRMKMVIPEEQVLPPATELRVAFDPHYTHLYKDGWLVS